MAIKIGHAAIDERGKASGGSAGDQTGREVCVRTWYAKPWVLVLRPKSATVAERMARACEAACVNANPTFQADWVPGAGTESLYTRIDEQHDGTKYDPIPYSGNMALENGKYYTQDGVLYLCNRDTGNPVYHSLSALVGLYVTVVEVN